MKEIVILGAGDFGREVAWLIEDINKIEEKYHIVGFLDDDLQKNGKIINGYKCLGPVSDLRELNTERSICAVIATQNASARERIVGMFPEFLNWETLIHPSVNVASTTTIGMGCVVCAGCNISCNTTIGNFCLFNISTTLGHDCAVDDYVSIMSGSCVSGRVKIGAGAYLATNCTVLPGKTVGTKATVGAGSVVIRNVKPNVTVMGVPAKALKF